MRPRGKLDILISETKAPSDAKSAKMKKWVIDNTFVSSWLINFMVPQLKRSFMYLSTAYEIWEADRFSFTDKKDLSLIFDVHRKIWKSSQGASNANDYLLELVGV